MSLLKNRFVQLILAVLLAVGVLLIPRPEGTRFQILGDPDQKVLAQVSAQ